MARQIPRAIVSLGRTHLAEWTRTHFAERRSTFAEFFDVGKVVRLADAQIMAWLNAVHGDMEAAPAFDALDACTVVGALLENGLNPCNGRTISPIRGVLTLALDRLEEFLGGEQDDGPGEPQEVAEPA